tara:strand:+ start:133 stop:927 length:795 start_codon:yes stop_codon:yes gene_type:complete
MKKYLVIGNPIKHSLSPELHNHWILVNNLDSIYERKKIDKIDVGKLIFEIKNKNIHGINVTVPFKKIIIPYLDNLSLESQKTQSVNTIYLKDDKIVGHNTDINGFAFAIKNRKFNLSKKKILIIGAGGVVSSIIYALKKMNVFKIFISNRTKNKAEDLKDLFNDLNIVEWGEIPEFDMIINATSVGLNKDDKLDLDFSKIGKNKFFYDVIYNPRETNFLKMGKKYDNICENGKMMFIYQAAEAFKIWHGIEPKIDNKVIQLLNK